MGELLKLFKNEIIIFFAGVAAGSACIYVGNKMISNDAREYGPDPDLSELDGIYNPSDYDM